MSLPGQWGQSHVLGCRDHDVLAWAVGVIIQVRGGRSHILGVGIVMSFSEPKRHPGVSPRMTQHLAAPAPNNSANMISNYP